MSLTILASTWLITGFLSGLIKISRKEFKSLHQAAIGKSGLGNPPNPKLFALAMSTLFGFYSVFVELVYEFSKK